MSNPCEIMISEDLKPCWAAWELENSNKDFCGAHGNAEDGPGVWCPPPSASPAPDWYNPSSCKLEIKMPWCFPTCGASGAPEACTALTIDSSPACSSNPSLSFPASLSHCILLSVPQFRPRAANTKPIAITIKMTKSIPTGQLQDSPIPTSDDKPGVQIVALTPPAVASLGLDLCMLTDDVEVSSCEWKT